MNINRTGILLGVVFVFGMVSPARSDNAESSRPDYHGSIWEQQTLTNSFGGLNDSLADSGIEIGLGITNIYQQNVRGGLSKYRRAGRICGSFDLEMWVDLQKMFGLETGSVYMLVEGGWPDAEGIDAASVGSAFGVNADAVGNDAMLVKELYYEGPIFDDRLSLMIGKIDFTGVFDSSAYADDEVTQFLNAAFVDDPTIPFPAYSLGVVLIYDLTDAWYVMGGIADAQADSRETGFRTTFHDEDYFFYALETGVTPQLNSVNGAMPGAYRIGMWVDAQDKARFSNSRNYRDDIGLYISCNQMLYKENSGPEDTQGLGVFGRFGYANSDLNPIGNFWSLGFQYQGLVDDRDDDVLGVGFAQGIFSDRASTTYTDDYENAVELYYSAAVTPWLNISPSAQYIANPGGSKAVSDAVVLGLRVQMIF